MSTRPGKIRASRNTFAAANEWIVEPADVDQDADEQIFFQRRNSTMRSNADDSSILTSMSFASLQIPECKPSEGEHEIDKRSFEQWRDVLEASMAFSGITEESTKMIVFRMKAGSRLMDVLEATVSSAKAPDEQKLPYSNVMHRLREFYGSRDNTLLQRQKLRSMRQEAAEGDVMFVKRVTSVAKQCDYGDEQLLECVADVVQSQAQQVKVREAARKIMRKEGTIAELLDKVRAVEIERQSEELYAKHHYQAPVNVAAVSYTMPFRRRPLHSNGHSPNYRGRLDIPRTRGAPRGRGGLNRFEGGNDNRRIPCWRCGSSFHRPHSCHAVEKVCRRCQIKGHIERMCHSEAPITMKRYAAESPELAPDSKMRKISAVTETSIDPEGNDDKKPVSEHN